MIIVPIGWEVKLSSAPVDTPIVMARSAYDGMLQPRALFAETHAFDIDSSFTGFPLYDKKPTNTKDTTA